MGTIVGIAVAVAVIYCFAKQFQSMQWHTFGKGERKARAEYGRLRRESPDSPDANLSEERVQSGSIVMARRRRGDVSIDDEKGEDMRSSFGRVRRVLGVAAVGALLAACGDSGLSGEYVGRQGSWVNKLVFGPGNEVRAVDDGDEAAGVFRVEGKQVILTIGTDQSALTIADNGCLDGGREAGVYCKR